MTLLDKQLDRAKGIVAKLEEQVRIVTQQQYEEIVSQELMALALKSADVILQIFVKDNEQTENDFGYGCTYFIGKVLVDDRDKQIRLFGIYIGVNATPFYDGYSYKFKHIRKTNQNNGYDKLSERLEYAICESVPYELTECATDLKIIFKVLDKYVIERI